MKQFLNKIQHVALAASLVCSIAMATAPTASAAPTSAPFTAGAKVSFTFDDGLLSTLTQAAPVLDKYGFVGTNYITTGCIDQTTVPNTCAADPAEAYMSWEQVAELQNKYGWEIASHSVTHPQLATDRLDGVITAEQMMEEITGSKAALNEHDFTGMNFADPYGDYDNTSVAAIAKHYASHRGFHDKAYNTFPYNDYLLTVQQVQAGVSVDTVKGYIDTAKANNQWLILVFHEIKVTPSADAEEYEYSTADLDAIAAYVKAQNIPVTDVAHGLATSSTNLFANGSFDAGIADGWTTDSPTTIVADNGDNGSYDGTATGATNSIAVTGSTTDTHLFSPTVDVAATQQYVIKSYINLTSVTSGEVSFYIDEYDAAGADLKSGRYVTGVVGSATPNALTVKSASIAYTPSSANVAKVRLQIIVHGATTKAYIDNVQMFPVSAIGTGVVVPPTGKVGDVNGDNVVNIQDATLVSLNWGKTGATKAQGDVNGDGTVNIQDATLISLNWSK